MKDMEGLILYATVVATLGISIICVYFQLAYQKDGVNSLHKDRREETKVNEK